jgi:hypothetical protein
LKVDYYADGNRTILQACEAFARLIEYDGSNQVHQYQICRYHQIPTFEAGPKMRHQIMESFIRFPNIDTCHNFPSAWKSPPTTHFSMNPSRKREHIITQ